MAADKLDKESKKWLEEVRPLLLPDEEKTFRGLKDKADREEFQKILDIAPDFELTPAEAGHPTWGPVFRSVKAQQR